MSKSISELLDEAIKNIESLRNNVTFELKDLFKGHDWNNLDTNTRLSLGKSFRSAVEHTLKSKVRILDKGSDNHCRYEKI